jgi:hypothetical protein
VLNSVQKNKNRKELDTDEMREKNEIRKFKQKNKDPRSKKEMKTK